MQSHLANYEFNPVRLSEVIGEGGSAIVYKKKIKRRNVAVKVLRQQLSKARIMKIAEKLLQVESEFIVKFIGYWIRPSAFLFEYCHLNVDGEVINTVSQFLDVLNQANKFFPKTGHFDAILSWIKST